MAEMELAIRRRQCLQPRFGDRNALAQAVANWTFRRNAAPSIIDWRFTTADARSKLNRLYPAIES